MEKAFTVTKSALDTVRESRLAPGHRRIIRTARTAADINAAARSGLRPLVKAVRPSPEVRANVAVFQNPATGEIRVYCDVREWSFADDLVVRISYYEYHFPNPFAAYLIPSDIMPGEEVWLEDLIEDLVAVWGNQGWRPRLASAPAIWNGKDFDILFDPGRDAEHWIG